MNNRIAMFLLGATLALGFTVAAYLLAGAVKTIRDDTGIRVKGFAEIPVKSDLATWRLEIMVRAKDLKEGYSTLEEDRSKVIARLKEYGFNEFEISSHAARVEEEKVINGKGNQTNEVDWYKIKQSLTVISKSPELINQSSKKITEIMSQGVRISSDQPQYTYGKLEELKISLLGSAAENALLRARTISEKAGCQISGIKSASQGVFQIVPVGSTEISDYGSYDTTTIDKMVKAVVTIDFTLAK